MGVSQQVFLSHKKCYSHLIQIYRMSRHFKTQKWIKLYIFVENICLDAVRDFTGCNQLRPFRAKLLSHYYKLDRQKTLKLYRGYEFFVSKSFKDQSFLNLLYIFDEHPVYGKRSLKEPALLCVKNFVYCFIRLISQSFT